MKTLLLDRTVWDLVLDASGNIALGAEPYAIAQDVGSAVKTFAGEVWYDKRIGVPHFEQTVGHWPPMPLIKSLMVQAALTVPDVSQAQCVITKLSDRVINGQVQIIDSTGAANNVSF